MKHHPTCRADYPEKPEGELPQQIVEVAGVKQCVDCGAFEITTADHEPGCWLLHEEGDDVTCTCSRPSGVVAELQ